MSKIATILLKAKKTQCRMVFYLALISIWIFATGVPLAIAEIRFGVTPYLSGDNLKASFEPILKQMSVVTGEDVTLVITRDYADLAEKMNVGLIDFGAFSPFAYVEAVKSTEFTIFASHCVNGRPWYQGFIICLKSNGYQTIDQLADKTFAFVDSKSASGFLYPRSLLIREGKNPDLFFGKTFFSGSHDGVIRDVLNRKADAGAVFSDALTMAESQYGRDTFQILMKTEPIPYDAYVARKGLEPRLVEKVKRFFLSLSDKEEPLKSILNLKKGVKFSGWISADDARYDVVRETAAMSRIKKRLAVFNFTASGKLIKQDKLNEVFSEITSAYFAQTNRYDVVPRYKLEQALLDHHINLNSDINSRMLSILKQDLGLDFIVFGDVFSGKKGLGVDFALHRTDQAQEKLHVEFTCPSVEEMGGLALKCVAWVQQQIPVEAYVVDVSRRLLTIDGGRDLGFAVNDSFKIVNLGEKVFNKDHTMIVGRKRRQVAEGRFQTVAQDTSTAVVSGGDINQVDIGSRIIPSAAGPSPKTGIYDSYLKGLTALAENNNETAIRLFKQVISIDPEYGMAHAKLSTAYFNMNDPENGNNHLEKARQNIDTLTFQERNYILARHATEAGDLKTAKELYLEILNKYPNNTPAMHNLGILYMESGRSDDMKQARHYFEQAMTMDPDLIITRDALASISYSETTDKTDKVDIVVVFDTTASMGDEIKGMIDSTEKFVSYLKGKHVNVALGLISFGDQLNNILLDPDDQPVLTTSQSQFLSHLKGFRAMDGGDEPENPYLAFEKALTYPFRQDSRKVFLLITDASAHMNDSFYPRDTSYVIKQLNKRKISAAIIGPEDNHYRQMARETEGVFIDIQSAPDFADKILQIGESIVHLF